MPDFGVIGDLAGKGFDKVVDTVDSGIDKGKEVVGEGVDWATDKAGQGLRHYGYDGVAEAVEDWGGRDGLLTRRRGRGTATRTDRGSQ
ncbi:putative T7SS-secreted protein [Streptomyces sp. NPDC005805]|uniref:putative T7SS-secreted protein n=1 Tax=Streptomyces sp. NPDC005805 TaxID=3157068 RepID=UPI0033DECA5D